MELNIRMSWIMFEIACLHLSLFESRFSDSDFHYQVQPYSAGEVGRPSFIVSHEQLSFLIENGFSVPQIADMIGVSISEFGLCIRARYSQLTDDVFDSIVHEIQVEFPFCGYRQMQGHLLSRGFRVHQVHERESQLLVDPHGVGIRSFHGFLLRRREYSIPSPRSLHHMDGYHKLLHMLGV